MADAIAENLAAQRQEERRIAAERANAVVAPVANVAKALGVGTAPVWQDIAKMGGVAGKALTALAVPGAVAVDTVVNRPIEYLTGMKMPDLTTPNIEAFSRAWGTDNKPTPVLQPTQTIKPTTSPAAAATPPVAGVGTPRMTSELGNPSDVMGPANLKGPSPATGTTEQPFTPPAGWTMSGKGGVTPQGEIPTITKVTKGAGEGGSTLLEAQGRPDLVPKLTPQEQAAKHINDLVTQYMNHGVKSKGDRKMVKELLKAQVAAGVGDEEKKERNAILREGVEARKEANVLASQDRKAAQSLKDDVDYAHRHTSFEYNEATGKNEENPTHTFLNMWERGEKIPERYKPGVDKAVAGFHEFYKRGLFDKNKKPLPPSKEAEQLALKAYREKTKMFPAAK